MYEWHLTILSFYQRSLEQLVSTVLLILMLLLWSEESWLSVASPAGAEKCYAIPPTIVHTMINSIWTDIAVSRQNINMTTTRNNREETKTIMSLFIKMRLLHNYLVWVFWTYYKVICRDSSSSSYCTGSNWRREGENMKIGSLGNIFEQQSHLDWKRCTFCFPKDLSFNAVLSELFGYLNVS